MSLDPLPREEWGRTSHHHPVVDDTHGVLCGEADGSKWAPRDLWQRPRGAAERGEAQNWKEVLGVRGSGVLKPCAAEKYLKQDHWTTGPGLRDHWTIYLVLTFFEGKKSRNSTLRWPRVKNRGCVGLL